MSAYNRFPGLRDMTLATTNLILLGIFAVLLLGLIFLVAWGLGA